jgi:hypothetical protein
MRHDRMHTDSYLWCGRSYARASLFMPRSVDGGHYRCLLFILNDVKVGQMWKSGKTRHANWPGTPAPSRACTLWALCINVAWICFSSRKKTLTLPSLPRLYNIVNT